MAIGKLDGAVRKRKSHKKSRKGCANCKMRRVKCDESQPNCQKCLHFGVECYYGTEPDALYLASSMEGAFQLDIVKRAPAPGPTLAEFIEGIAQAAPPAPGLSPTSSEGEVDLSQGLDEFDAAVFEFFRGQTAHTVGTAISAPVYAREIPRLACKHQYLMHMVLTVALRHYRFLTEDTGTDPRLIEAEAFHWYNATAQFNDVLSRPITENDKDALWATAAFLGAMSWTEISATHPEEAWPMKPWSPEDLEWMKMGAGKTAIWRLADPLRSTSCFRPALAKEAGDNFTAKTVTVPSKQSEHQEDLYMLCNLTKDGIGESSNPYTDLATTMARLLAIEIDDYNLMEFIVPLSHQGEALKTLLESKDPKALLLLSLWYAKVIPCKRWWLRRRAEVECKSIVMFLDRWHWQDGRLQKLLRISREACGYKKEGRNIFHPDNPQPPWLSGKGW